MKILRSEFSFKLYSFKIREFTRSLFLVLVAKSKEVALKRALVAKLERSELKKCFLINMSLRELAFC